MRKLSDDEPTLTFRLRMTESMRNYLDRQKGGASKYVRALIAARMLREQRKVGSEDRD